MRVILREKFVCNIAKLSYYVRGLSKSVKLPSAQCAQNTSPF